MSNSLPQVLMHSAPSLYKHLDAFAQIVESAVRLAGASEDEQVDLMVAVMEALNNAIDHGNGEDASKKVHLKIDIHPASIHGPGCKTREEVLIPMPHLTRLRQKI